MLPSIIGTAAHGVDGVGDLLGGRAPSLRELAHLVGNDGASSRWLLRGTRCFDAAFSANKLVWSVASSDDCDDLGDLMAVLDQLLVSRCVIDDWKRSISPNGLPDHLLALARQLAGLGRYPVGLLRSFADVIDADGHPSSMVRGHVRGGFTLLVVRGDRDLFGSAGHLRGGLGDRFGTIENGLRLS